MKTNALSALGRMSYAAHLGLYPVVGGSLWFVWSAWSKSSKEASEKQEWDTMPKARTVDPDDFQPFSAIPFHNNPELRYRYGDVKMFGYIDKKTGLNVDNYFFKGFHNSYDHDDTHKHYYNWISTIPAHNA